MLAPKGDLVFVKALIVVSTRRLNGRVVGRVGLDDDLAPQDASPGAPRHLGQQLESPLPGAKVGQVDDRVGGDDAHQGHAGQVQALGDHLCADHDVGLAVDKAIEDLFVGQLAPRGVQIPTHDPGLGVGLAHQLFDALSADAKEFDATTPATGTLRRHKRLVIAVMADQIIDGGMVGEGKIAARAFEHVPTVAAHHKGR